MTKTEIEDEMEQIDAQLPVYKDIMCRTVDGTDPDSLREQEAAKSYASKKYTELFTRRSELEILLLVSED